MINNEIRLSSLDSYQYSRLEEEVPELLNKYPTLESFLKMVVDKKTGCIYNKDIDIDKSVSVHINFFINEYKRKQKFFKEKMDRKEIDTIKELKEPKDFLIYCRNSSWDLWHVLPLIANIFGFDTKNIGDDYEDYTLAMTFLIKKYGYEDNIVDFFGGFDT